MDMLTETIAKWHRMAQYVDRKQISNEKCRTE